MAEKEQNMAPPIICVATQYSLGCRCSDHYNYLLGSVILSAVQY